MLIPSSSPLLFPSDDSDASVIAKHMQGMHDQSFHAGGGRAAAYARMALDRKKRMDRDATVLGMKSDSRGRVICPEATGGYKAHPPIPTEITFHGEKLTPEHSLWHHLESDGNGGYQLTAERAALHKEIIERATSGIPASENPTFFMLGGGPAAGKTTALKSGIVSGVPAQSEHRAVFINADDVKSELPEFERMRMSGDNKDFFNAASFAHEESSYLAKRIQKAAVENQQDIVLDGTGDSSMGKLDKKIREASSAGYAVQGIYFTVPTNTAWERAKGRSLNSAERRFVPEKVVRDTHRDVSKTFVAAANSKAFDRLILVDSTTRGAAKIIGQTNSPRGKFEVQDQAAFDAFVEKGNE